MKFDKVEVKGPAPLLGQTLEKTQLQGALLCLVHV